MVKSRKLYLHSLTNACKRLQVDALGAAWTDESTIFISVLLQNRFMGGTRNEVLNLLRPHCLGSLSSGLTDRATPARIVRLVPTVPQMGADIRVMLEENAATMDRIAEQLELLVDALARSKAGLA